MNDFYLTLPSNASLLNTTANFSVHLPQKLNLQGRWEVALVEIQYPFSWNNIGGSGIYDKGNWIDVTFQDETTATILIPPATTATSMNFLLPLNMGKNRPVRTFKSRWKRLISTRKNRIYFDRIWKTLEVDSISASIKS